VLQEEAARRKALDGAAETPDSAEV